MATKLAEEEKSSRPKGGFHVVFYKQRYCEGTNQKFTEYRARLKFISGTKTIWEHDGPLESHTPIHHLFRVLKFLPENVDRAYHLNCETNEKKEDGSFLINLLQVPLRHIKENLLHLKSKEDLMIFETTNLTEQTTVGHFLRYKSDNLSLYHVVLLLIDTLSRYSRSLKDYDEEEIIRTSEALRRYNADISIFYQVYENIVHPKLLDNIRNRV